MGRIAGKQDDKNAIEEGLEGLKEEVDRVVQKADETIDKGLAGLKETAGDIIREADETIEEGLKGLKEKIVV